MLMRAAAAEPTRMPRRLGDDTVSVTIVLLGVELLTKVRAEAEAMIV
jgi:hypothetical protein